MAAQEMTMREVYLADMYEAQIRRKDAQIQKLERAIAEHLLSHESGNNAFCMITRYNPKT